jgi:hypothetical protein
MEGTIKFSTSSMRGTIKLAFEDSIKYSIHPEE